MAGASKVRVPRLPNPLDPARRASAASKVAKDEAVARTTMAAILAKRGTALNIGSPVIGQKDESAHIWGRLFVIVRLRF
jgi:hypothetical protein